MAMNSHDTWQELLIELVKGRSCLYDKQHHGYHDSRGVRADSWDEIVKGMDEGGYSHIIPSTTVAMDKWTNIRDGFVRAKRKFETQYKEGSTPPSAPNYIYWQQLQWLLPFYNNKSESGANITNILMETTQSMVPARKRKKMQPPAASDSQISHFSSALTRVLNAKDGDEHDLFGKMVACETRKIDDEERLLDAKLEIMAIIKRARFPPTQASKQQSNSLQDQNEHSN